MGERELVESRADKKEKSKAGAGRAQSEEGRQPPRADEGGRDQEKDKRGRR